MVPKYLCLYLLFPQRCAPHITGNSGLGFLIFLVMTKAFSLLLYVISVCPLIFFSRLKLLWKLPFNCVHVSLLMSSVCLHSLDFQKTLRILFNLQKDLPDKSSAFQKSSSLLWCFRNISKGERPLRIAIIVSVLIMLLQPKIFQVFEGNLLLKITLCRMSFLQHL